ncbi:MAG TPA: bifunctional diaminohydroxyphosphoribosylaminopyrimidine deaminase/5-amino-6-(5-phosphoribosylamino)uracil reductase RibD [Candidatus Nanoarchaeia archaeon]|nr:bifunctional diaminohydroxyphosphoribosylaminopyrimidine deaminase/5-amino-6-(5-phosphoribosylamino)uracil reductase RibD [Candidatus Nanoarchaeia archaeon]
MISHKKYMELALKLAEKGRGTTSPNPMVGCIIVKRGRIVGKGFHKKAGCEHAEVLAIESAGKKTANSTMYVTLEPCSHWGKTPPCTEKIVEAGVREVIIGMKDPNPLVEGFRELKFRGLKTKIGILEDEAKKLNEAYIKYMKTKKPFVILKVAMSLDGKIATSKGDSKYITSKEARTYVHEIRSSVDAVMVGLNTVLRDNPELTVRHVEGKDPLKIVVDSQLKIPKNCNLMKEPSKLIIATTNKASKKDIVKLEQKGIRIIITKSQKGMVDLNDLMKQLGKHEIMSIMMEGGSQLNSSAIKDGVVDKVIIFTAPKIIGNGVGAIGNLGVTKINKAIPLKGHSFRKIGKDLLIEGYL